MKYFNKLSLRTRLFLLVLVVALPAATTNIFSYFEEVRYRVEETRGNGLRILDGILQRQEMIASNTRQLLSTLAEVPSVRKRDGAACEALFKELLALNPHYSIIMALAPDGIAFASTSPLETRDFSDRKYYRDVLRTGNFSVGEYSIGRLTGVPVLQFAHPVKDSRGRLVAILMTALKLDRYAIFINERPLPQGYVLTIADHEGRRLFRFPAVAKLKLGAPVSMDVWQKMGQHSDEGGIEGIGADGIERFYTFEKLRLRPGEKPYLHVYIGVDRETLLAPVRYELIKDLAVLCLVILLGAGMALLMGRWTLLNPLNRLASMARQIAAGKLGARTGIDYGDAEIGQLARACDGMAETIEREIARQTRSEDLLRQMVDAAPFGVYIYELERDGNLVMIGANRAADHIVGIDHAPLIGQPIEAIFPGLTSTDLPALFRRVARGKMDYSNDNFSYDGLGTRRRFEVRALCSGENRITVFFRDVTELKKKELLLFESEERYRQLVESSPDIILVHSAEKIIFVNRSGVEKLGAADASVLLGLPLCRLHHPDNHALIRERLALLEKGQAVPVIEEKYVRLDGGPLDVEVFALPFLHQGRPAVQVIARDISERKRLEEQLRQGQKMEAIGTLAGGIAHDFNNILGAIFGYTEMSLDEAVSDDQRLYLHSVLKSAERAKNLVAQILAFSRRHEMESKPLDVRTLVREALKMLRSVIPATIEIRAEIASDSCPVLGDATQIHQIVMNLCTNAFQAMQGKPGIMTIRVGRQRLFSRSTNPHMHLAAGSYIILTVEDTGCGIAPRIRERIFDPFFTTKRVGEGTGLGLSVVLGIVKSHGGTIDVRSEEQRGSAFTVYLPALDGEMPEKTADAVRMRPSGGHQERILYVDDEEALLDVGARLLGSLGYRVTTAADPAKALAMFIGDPSAFDAVITDLTMPKMTGIDLARTITEIRPDLPIILSTGYSDLVRSEEMERAGIRKCIQKPLSAAMLAQAVSEVLEVPG